MSSMRAMRSVVTAGVLVPVFALVAACSGKDPFSPGNKLGTFHVTGKLTHTSCGPTPNPWEFDVRLNHDGSTLYWIQGGLPVEGRVDTTARAQLEAEVVSEVRPADARAKKDACSISRTDVLALTLVGPDGQPTSDPSVMQSFRGSLVYTFAPTAGSDCSDQTTASGGDFDALPCDVQYDVSGSLTSAAAR